jgi:NhaP-type Na+/H+ or K+/H+ antiporter
MVSDLSQLGFLLFVSALVAMLMQRLRMPYTVGLVLAGMGLYFLHISIKWHLSRDLIFFVFLPPLAFEAALFMDRYVISHCTAPSDALFGLSDSALAWPSRFMSI